MSLISTFKNNNKASVNNIYKTDGAIPLNKAILFGLQHILAMFVANITPIIIVAGACNMPQKDVAMLIQLAMIIAGIGTLIQLFPIWRIGSGLPIVMGISFTFVSVLCVIGSKYGYGAVVFGVIIGGIVEGFLGLFAKYWMRFITPIVSANVVTAIGLSLLSVGAASFGGGTGSEDFGSVQNWILGTFTLVCCLLFNVFKKGHSKHLSVLFGLIMGYIAAIIMGKIDLSQILEYKLIELPDFFRFTPEFHIETVIAVVVIFIVSATETMGDTYAVCATGLLRDVTEKEMAGSIACDGFISALSGLFGCMPITSFSQNVGLVAMTKVVNRMAIAAGAVIMILAGIFPMLGGLLASLPDAVLGGCTIMMFGNIVICGIQMLEKCGYSQRNITISALSLSIGMGFTQVSDIFNVFPEIIRNIFAGNCVAVVFVVSLVLSLILPKEKN